MPLIYGTGPLTPETGWDSQAQVLINARLAGEALGATPMVRPEDVQPDVKSGKVYVMLTNNHKRKEDQVDTANPQHRPRAATSNRSAFDLWSAVPAPQAYPA